MEKILFVDDDPNILSACQRQLRKKFDIETMVGPEQGLTALASKERYAVIITDMRMPGMDGIEFLRCVGHLSPESVRMMLTGNADQQTAIDAVNEGNIFRFLTKPCPPELLETTILAGLEQYRLVMAEKVLLEQTLNGSIQLLTELLGMVEPRLFGRSKRVRDRVRTLVRHLDWGTRWEIEIAALLSQIGMVTLPSDTLAKYHAGQPLSKPEELMLLSLPEISHRLVKHIPRLESVGEAILFAKKNFDGSGFPESNAAGEEIPKGARVLKLLNELAESEDEGVSTILALERMRNRQGWYDPELLDAAFQCFAPEAVGDHTGSAPTRAISVKDLKPGDTLASDVETSDGMILVSAGFKVTQLFLERLRNFDQLSVVREPIYIEVE